MRYEGRIDLLVADYDQHAEEWASLDGRLIQLPADRPDALRHGQRVRLEAVPVQAHGLLDRADDDQVLLCRTVEVLEAPEAPLGLLGALPVEDTTLVMPVLFADSTAPAHSLPELATLLEQTRQAFLQPTFSDGQWTIRPTILPSIPRINALSTVCDHRTIWEQAQAAAAGLGFDPRAYRRHIVVLPFTQACGWWGLGTIGGSPSCTWTNGRTQVGLYLHELGHNLGLYHAHSRECGSVTYQPSGCAVIEYGDTTDVMGGATGSFPGGPYNAWYKRRIGWLTPAEVPEITASGRVTLPDARAPRDGRPRAVTVGPFLLEFRQRNPELAPSNDKPMLLLRHRPTATDTYLLDGQPGTSTWMDPGLPAGQPFIEGALRLLPVALPTTGDAEVEVLLDTPPPPPPPPPPAGGLFRDDFAGPDSTDLAPLWREVSGDLIRYSGQLRNGATRGLHAAQVAHLTGLARRVAARFAAVANLGGPRFLLTAGDLAIGRQVGGSAYLGVWRGDQLLGRVSQRNPTAESFWVLEARWTPAGCEVWLDGQRRLTLAQVLAPDGPVGVAILATTSASAAPRSHRVDWVEAEVIPPPPPVPPIPEA